MSNMHFWDDSLSSIGYHRNSMFSSTTKLQNTVKELSRQMLKTLFYVLSLLAVMTYHSHSITERVTTAGSYDIS
jgi:hypothetical protein